MYWNWIELECQRIGRDLSVKAPLVMRVSSSYTRTVDEFGKSGQLRASVSR
jgi:hypothetical protein